MEKKLTNFKICSIISNVNFTVIRLFENVYTVMSKTQNKTDLLNHIIQNGKIWNIIESITLSLGSKDQIYSTVYGYQPKHAFPNSKFCAKATRVNETFKSTNTCHVIFQSSNDKISFFERYNIIHVMLRNTSKTELYSCQSFHLNSSCLLGKIKTYSIDNQTQTLRSSHLKKGELEVSQYLPYKDGIAVCMDEIKSMERKPDWKNVLSTVEEYITKIGLPTSIAFVIFLLWQFHYVKEKTLPHCDATALCICLVLCDMLLLLNSFWLPWSNGCYVIGVTLHWLSLSIHVLVHVDFFPFLLRQFYVSQATSSSVRGQFIKHVVFAILTSSFLVLSTILLDRLSFLEQGGYGGNGICWIIDEKARIYFYILPTGIFYFISMTSLCFAIGKIRSVNMKNTSVMKKEDKERYTTRKIALKFALVLGLIEVIGFIQIRKDNLTTIEEAVNALSAFSFTLFRSFRGTILAIIYLQKMKPSYKKIMQRVRFYSSAGVVQVE